MKIRTGYVSNSSSTSFCIYGIETEFLIPKGYKESEQESEITEIKSGDSYNVGEVLEDLCEKKGLKVYTDYESCYLYIGRNYTDIGNNETGKEFKDSVEKKIRALFKNHNWQLDNIEFKSITQEICS